MVTGFFSGSEVTQTIGTSAITLSYKLEKTASYFLWFGVKACVNIFGVEYCMEHTLLDDVTFPMPSSCGGRKRRSVG